MGHERKGLAALLLAAALACSGTSAASAAGPGGSGPAQGVAAGGSASSPRLEGGSEYGANGAPALVYRPTVALLSVPASAAPGRPPRVTLRIDEPGAGAVQVRVTVTDLSTRRAVLVVSLGWVRTGRSLTVRWPRGAKLAPGSYHVSLTARDSHSATLLRRAHASGVATLVIAAPSESPPAAQQGGSAGAPAGVPTPAQLAAMGAVFPVGGAHNYGGPENRFGAPRHGYSHQGQDVLTSEGTPVLAPLAGEILTASYQEGGAGYYVAEHTAAGFDFFFAHCMAGSLAVASGQSVAAGALLCRAGQTGDATAPHLHFEIWVGGWRSAGGYPIDPLAYLQALDHTGAGG
jgi:murein DD-endopeptidase MepM/ murein hydrolase activator NlpD